MGLIQFEKLSSWRENILEINAKGVGTLDFLDTHPNMFVMQNPNPTVAYVGITKTPTVNAYEFKVGNNSIDCFGIPTSTTKLMVYNDSDQTISVKIYSIFDDFDILVLKNMQSYIESATVVTDGIVKGFSSGVMLPSGNNHLGEVSLRNFANSDVSEIPTIGKVNVSNFAELMQALVVFNSDFNDFRSAWETLNDLYNQYLQGISSYVQIIQDVNNNIAKQRKMVYAGCLNFGLQLVLETEGFNHLTYQQLIQRLLACIYIKQAKLTEDNSDGETTITLDNFSSLTFNTNKAEFYLDEVSMVSLPSGTVEGMVLPFNMSMSGTPNKKFHVYIDAERLYLLSPEVQRFTISLHNETFDLI